MEGFSSFWAESDAVGRSVALLMLLMSVCSWVLILWKAWVLRRCAADLGQAIPTFWAAPDWIQGRERLAAIDREGVIVPLLDACSTALLPDSLAAKAAVSDPASQLTRRLRDALHASLAHLKLGQVFLASVGSTSPFIGLFGTVWGIYHALVTIASAGGVTIEKVAGPVGEALIMTAAGLAVAIPAVLAYNLFGKWVSAAEAELEGFAHDLRLLVATEGTGRAP